MLFRSRANGSGGFRVFAVNHGGRESIEIFDVTSPGANARVTWRGCLLVPKDVLANGVASLPGGRVVVSGQNVTIWSPRSGWRGYTPGVIKRANGVIASPDGRWLYINGSDDYTVNLVATDGRMEDRKVLITSEFAHADNIRRGSDGKLYTAGTYVKPEDAKACFTSKLCNVPTVVIVTDPKTNIARELIRIPPSVGAFGAGTVALRVGNELWIGASKGDRVAIIPMPK